MSYEIEDIKNANKIFYYILNHGELSEDEERELYKLYSENEEIMNLVKRQGEAFDCTIEKYGGIIYLIPNENNEFLGYSKLELKKELCKSSANDKDYYLSQFVILTILVEFYDSQGRSSKSREYMKTGELLNTISERLKEGAEKYSEEDQDENGIAFTNILERFEALRSSDKHTIAKTTKEGFLHTILKFLESQGLIDYIQGDDMIKTTKKLDDFMDWNILNKNNYRRVLVALGEDTNE